MKLTVLVENTSCGNTDSAHGLSIHIETQKHIILFDAGPDGALLQKNAKTLGIDLQAIDLAFLSHGHFDHVGGMRAFLELNRTAPLYIQRSAADPHYALEQNGLRDIGIEPALTEQFSDRLHLTDAQCRIDDTILGFSDVETADYLSGSNTTLMEIDGEDLRPDRFLHEQNLLIEENGKLILVAGCAHRGIINILRRAKAITGKAPDAVYAGFHLTNPSKGLDEPVEFVRSVGEELSRWPCRFYTGHCTGQGPFNILKEILGDRLTYLNGGAVFEE